MHDPLVIAIEAVVHHYWMLLTFGLACVVLGFLAASLCIAASWGGDDSRKAMQRHQAARRGLGIS